MRFKQNKEGYWIPVDEKKTDVAAKNKEVKPQPEDKSLKE